MSNGSVKHNIKILLSLLYSLKFIGDGIYPKVPATLRMSDTASVILGQLLSPLGIKDGL